MVTDITYIRLRHVLGTESVVAEKLEGVDYAFIECMGDREGVYSLFRKMTAMSCDSGYAERNAAIVARSNDWHFRIAYHSLGKGIIFKPIDYQYSNGNVNFVEKDLREGISSAMLKSLSDPERRYEYFDEATKRYVDVIKRRNIEVLRQLAWYKDNVLHKEDYKIGIVQGHLHNIYNELVEMFPGKPVHEVDLVKELGVDSDFDHFMIQSKFTHPNKPLTTRSVDTYIYLINEFNKLRDKTNSETVTHIPGTAEAIDGASKKTKQIIMNMSDAELKKAVDGIIYDAKRGIDEGKNTTPSYTISYDK